MDLGSPASEGLVGLLLESSVQIFDLVLELLTSFAGGRSSCRSQSGLVVVLGAEVGDVGAKDVFQGTLSVTG